MDILEKVFTSELSTDDIKRQARQASERIQGEILKEIEKPTIPKAVTESLKSQSKGLDDHIFS